MKRFFAYRPSVWAYFGQVDGRLRRDEAPPVKPASVGWGSADLGGIRAVLWDVYGTLLGVDIGDLEQTCQVEERLEQAAAATIAEFRLESPLHQLAPGRPGEQYLYQRYLELIDASHQRSRAAGIEYPEVVIEEIWHQILRDCIAQGYQPPETEATIDTAYRWAYFFDASLQQNFLYPGIKRVLEALKKAGINQGIISNAQFYTPLQLRRLLRAGWRRSEGELQEIFTAELVLFSYELGYSKPHPGAFSKAIDILAQQGIKRKEILYIGNDMLNDVWAASGGGMRTILFAVDERQTVLREDDERCRDLRPDGVVTEADQVAELVLA